VAASSWRSGRSKIRAGRRGLKGDNRLIDNWFWPSPTSIIGSFYEVMTGCRKCLTLLLLSLIDCFKIYLTIHLIELFELLYILLLKKIKLYAL
jgi:hypothetical protein